jgi:hypothetical protein
MKFAKKVFRYMDKKFFKSYFVELRGYQLLKKQRFDFDSTFQRSLRINYVYKENKLAELCDRFGTDKGSNLKYNSKAAWPSHTYTDYYHDIFNENRFNVKNIFECGIGSNNSDVKGHFKLESEPGASLKVWREYFPNAVVYGADIDSRCLVQDDRIISMVMDQTEPDSIREYFDQVGSEEFDIMIDDGLHEFSAGIILFENAYKHLKFGGIYIIEDVVLEDLQSYQVYFAESRDYIRFVSLQRDVTGLKSIAHNSLIVIEKRDLHS